MSCILHHLRLCSSVLQQFSACRVESEADRYGACCSMRRFIGLIPSYGRIKEDADQRGTTWLYKLAIVCLLLLIHHPSSAFTFLRLTMEYSCQCCCCCCGCCHEPNDLMLYSLVDAADRYIHSGDDIVSHDVELWCLTVAVDESNLWGSFRLVGDGNIFVSNRCSLKQHW